MLKRKPAREVGQDLRSLPTYTIPEAASFLAIPRRTMRAWFTGQQQLLDPSMRIGSASLLSFSDLSEAYIVQMLRRVYGIPMGVLRRSLEIAKRETGSKHPLLGHDIRIFAKSLILSTPAIGRSRRMLDLSSGRGTQLAIADVVDACGKRITFDRQLMPIQLFPWRHLDDDCESRPVALDPEVMSGRLVIAGTRIPVSFLVGMRREGKSIDFIATDYGIPPMVVRQALEHVDQEAA